MLIITQRSYQHWPSYDLVYEWEDELVKALPSTKLFYAKEAKIRGHDLYNTLYRRLRINVHQLALRNKSAFMFAMAPILDKNIWNLPNIKVNIVDFYPTEQILSAFYKNYNRVDTIYVSSREVYDYLVSHNPQREIRHLPLTLPDKYRITKESSFNKVYDLVMVGRQSPTMTGYLHEYVKTHHISYVYRGKIEGNNFPYYTNKGEFVGYVNTRDDYFRLLRSGRIVLYSTPGIDDGKETHGFHQVTPRFLEALSCGCHVISQFVDNSDTDYFELGRMSHRVDNYHDFKSAMKHALNTEVHMGMITDYLEKHYTSFVHKHNMTEI